MNNLYKKNIENIINYLLTFDVENIKFIWIKRIKKNNTIKKEVIVENVVLEDGYSISFDSHNVNFMLALDKLNNFNHIKNQIKLFLKSNNIKKIKNIKKFKLESVSCFNKNKNKSVFDCKKYQEEIIKFLNDNSNTSISIQLLYENKNTLIVRPFIKNIYKEEFNYKMDILMNYIVNKLHRFNYKSIGSANNFEKILNFNIHNEFVNLQKTLLKMDTLHNFEQKCDVVICKGIGGILFHEICGHSLESREIIKKNSIFYDVKDVNNKNINFIDDATIVNEFGFYNIDDEGNTSKKLPLIKNGKIVNYLCDERGKKILLQKFSSSCRRETYYNKFSSRMSNTYIEKGNCEVKDIVTSVENGFYIKNILGGVVDTTSGNFSFNCLESYRIKNGLIDFSKCYDNLTIVGNAMQIIKNVDKIGNDFELNCGICGSDSGFVYTTVGQPTIKVKDVLSFENNKEIIEDVKKNNFLIFNPFRKNFLIKLNRFIKRLLKEICNSPFKYSLDISYNYTKSKSDDSIKKKYDVFYELNINCYDEKRKIGFHKKIKTKALNFNKLKSEIFCYEEILKNKINANEGIINSGQVLFEKYAFSQIMSNYKKELWNIRKFINVESKIIISKGRTCKDSNKNKMNFNTALNEITDCKYLMFKNSNVINNPLLELKKGYVILNIYFLNNNKEHRNYIKILCSGYYVEEGKIKFIFTNKIFHFNLLSLINDIEYVSSSSCFSNDFICPDVLTKI